MTEQPEPYNVARVVDGAPLADRLEQVAQAAARRVLLAKHAAREMLAQRLAEWALGGGTKGFTDALAIFEAGYRLGRAVEKHGEARLGEPYWTERADPDGGTYTEGPRP